MPTGADINALAADERSVLHFACIKGHAGVVSAIIEAGGALNIADANGHTPLHLCRCLQHAACVSLLLGAGADEACASAEMCSAESFA
jgi:ankyrin repeat protein